VSVAWSAAGQGQGGERQSEERSGGGPHLE
jgi:hypothetical protein